MHADLVLYSSETLKFLNPLSLEPRPLNSW